LRFTYNTSNMNIIQSTLYNQNEVIQLLNPQPKVLKINDDSNNTKNVFGFNLWTHEPEHLMSQKIHENWNESCSHLTKEFSTFNNCMHNWQKNCNSFFRIDLASFDIIYPKKKPFFSTIVISTSALAWFK